jgi:hypothetical protein
MKKILFVFTSLFMLSYCVRAQSNDSLFVQRQDNNNVIIATTATTTNLLNLSKEYNISAELLSIFNSVSRTETITKNTEIVVPLAESNYYKNTNLKFQNGTYVPLFYKVLQSESLIAICKKFIIPESSIYRWNNLQSANLNTNDVLLVGWLRFGNATAAIATNNTDETKKTVGETKQNFAKGFENVGQKFNTTLSKIGGKIKATSNSILKPKTATVSDKIVPPVITEVPKQKVENNTLSHIKKGAASTAITINKGLKNIGTSISKTTSKITGNMGTAYQRERASYYKIKTQDSLDKLAIENKKYNAPIKTITTENSIGLDIENKDVTSNNTSKLNTTIPDTETQKDTSTSTALYGLAGITETATNTKTQAELNDEKLLEESEKLAEQKNKITTTESQVKPTQENSITINKNLNYVSGKASWFYAGTLDKDYFVFTNVGIKNSDVAIVNPTNGISIIAKVMGALTEAEVASGLKLLLSDNAKSALNCIENKPTLKIALLNK